MERETLGVLEALTKVVVPVEVAVAVAVPRRVGGSVLMAEPVEEGVEEFVVRGEEEKVGEEVVLPLPVDFTQGVGERVPRGGEGVMDPVPPTPPAEAVWVGEGEKEGALLATPKELPVGTGPVGVALEVSELVAREAEAEGEPEGRGDCVEEGVGGWGVGVPEEVGVVERVGSWEREKVGAAVRVGGEQRVVVGEEVDTKEEVRVPARP